VAFCGATREFDAGADAQLTEDLAQVIGDGMDADVKLVGDLLIRGALSDEFGYVPIGVCEAVPSG
jgi:hypothetical protein